ncbi:MAG TPA: F0F1 ATP synthase subunit gamma [Methylocella sp.]|nr:F0F1 ATP synthase subunit gamma [Methylocella sp.]
MSESLSGLRRKIDSAAELKSVVRTMKALAASSIGQYEKAVLSLNDYYRTVQLGLAACLRQSPAEYLLEKKGDAETGPAGAFIFGSDQGLVGPFNDVLAAYAATTLASKGGKKDVWAIGTRMESCLADLSLPAVGVLTVPNSIPAITPLVGRILVEIDARRRKDRLGQVYIFHHRPKSKATYEPVGQRLLPLDTTWRATLADLPWPSQNLPEVMGGGEATLSAFLREYLFVSLFRACIESLTSENASRLAAMQRAEKNIDELREDLNRTFHRLRQSTIDEELFDVVSGYESLSSEKGATRANE